MTSCFYHVFATVYISLFHSQMFVGALLIPTARYQGQMCVCSRHTSLFIYPTASEHVQPIGALYTGDCRLYGDKNTVAVGKFLPVVHDHQTGYVYNDADVDLVHCPDFVIDPSDKLTTMLQSSSTKPFTNTHKTTVAASVQTMPTTASHSTPTTTASHALPTASHAHSGQIRTTPSTTTIIQDKGCNTVALFTEIAYNKNVGIHNSAKCQNGIHYDSDAAITAFCSAPDPSLWLRGTQVTTHCSQLPQFTPIAVFDRQSTYQKSAAILLECTQNVIYVAMQDCTSGLHIRNISATDQPSSSEYHMIEWP